MLKGSQEEQRWEEGRLSGFGEEKPNLALVLMRDVGVHQPGEHGL